MTMICDGRPFTLTDAREVGISRRELDELRLIAAVRPVVRGVYVDAQVPDDLGTRALALARVLPSDAVICRRTAAWLYGVDAREPGGTDRCPSLTSPFRQDDRRSVEPACTASSRTLRDDDVDIVAGVPVTTPLRTAVDLARWLPRRSAMACARRTDAPRPGRQARAHGGGRTLRGLRLRRAGARHLPTWPSPRPRSFGESWLRLRIVDSGFPRFEPQIEIRDVDGVLVFLIDLGLRSKKKGVEYDGEEHHSTAADIAHDESRRTRLDREFGWEVIGFGRDAVLGRGHQLEEAVATLLGMAPERRAIPIQPPAPDDWDFTGERSRRAGRTPYSIA